MSSKYDSLRSAVRKLKPGEAFVATELQDFTCQPASFQGVVHQAAKNKGDGWKATTTIIGHHVVYAFYRRTDYLRPNLQAYPIVRKMRGEA